MKKYLTTFIIAVAGLLMTSCETGNETNEGKQPLPAPEVKVESQTSTSFMLSWPAVEGAGSYTYEFLGEEGSVQDTFVEFTELESGTTYDVRLKAVPEDTEVFVESGWTEISVTLDESENPDGTSDFVIDYTDIPEAMTVVYKITPKDNTMWFYRDCFEDSSWEELGANPDDVWANALQGYIDFFGTSAFMMVAEKGVVESQFNYIYDQNTYILVAGIDEEMNRITPVYDTLFYSGPVQMSDITFEVEALDVTTSSARVSVQPSNMDPYSMLLMKSEALAGYSDEDIENLIKIDYSEYIPDGHIYEGPLTMVYHEGQLDADTEYMALLFGWNTTLNSEVYKYTFRTEKATSSEGLTFEWEIEVLGPTEIHAVITPSDVSAEYIVIPMPEYQYKDPSIIDEDGNIDINYYIEEMVCMGMISPVEYASMFARTGVTDRIFDEGNDGIYPGSSYKFLAVGVDLDREAWTVKFYDPSVYDEIITTPNE